MGHGLERNVGSASSMMFACAPVDTTGYSKESRLAGAIS
jgi:hypothetical protein